jgi:hypothetical protein
VKLGSSAQGVGCKYPARAATWALVEVCPNGDVRKMNAFK